MHAPSISPVLRLGLPPGPAPRALGGTLLLAAALLGCGDSAAVPSPGGGSALAESADLPRLASDARIDPEIADTLASAFAAARPDDPASILRLANVYAANSLFELAARTYALVPGAADDAKVQFHLGRCLAAEGRPGEALDAFERAAVLAPEYAPTHWRRAQVLFDLGRLDDARAAFERALAIEPNSAQAELGLARVHLARNEPQAAVELLEPIAKADPRVPFVNGLLARAYRQIGRPQRAARALHREQNSRPRNVPDPWTAEVLQEATGLLVHLNRASALLTEGDPRGALAILEPLRGTHSSNDALLTTLARAWLATGEPGKVLALVEGASGDHSGSFQVVWARALAASGRSEQGLAKLHTLVARSEGFAEAWEAIGEIELQRGNPEPALEALLAAQEGERESVRLSGLIARARITLGDFDGAAGGLHEALALHPRSGFLYASLADAESRAGRIEQAREALESAVARDPSTPLIGVVRSRLEGHAPSPESKQESGT